MVEPDVSRHSVTDARTEIRFAMALAEAVYRRRIDLRPTQAELADRARLTRAEISRIEGSDATLSLPLMMVLARALEASLRVSIDDDNPQVSFVPHVDPV